MMRNACAKTLLLLVLVVLVSSCGDDKGTNPVNSLIGTWNLSSMQANGADADPADWHDVPVRVEFRSDSTGGIWYEDFGIPESSSPDEFTWHTSGNILSAEYPDGGLMMEVVYSINDGILTIATDNTEIEADNWVYHYTKQ